MRRSLRRILFPQTLLIILLVHAPSPQIFSNRFVEVGLWSSSGVVGLQPQYVDVLYAFGYYSCYTLSIDLQVSYVFG